MDVPALRRHGLAAALALSLLCACNAAPGIEGIYRSAPGTPKVSMEISPRGAGMWKTETDAESFEWQAQGAEILIHTNKGGVLKGQLRDKAIALDLPDIGEVVLTRK